MESDSQSVPSSTAAETMDCGFSAENSVVVNINLDSENRDALLQTVEAAMCIVKQEPEGETSLDLHNSHPSLSLTERGVSVAELPVDPGQSSQTLQIISSNQGEVLCIVKEEQTDDNENYQAQAPAFTEENSGEDNSELVSVVIQTKGGESLNIQIPRKTLVGYGLGDQLPVFDSQTGDGTYQFECFLCGATFKKAAYLKAHMPVHTGEKPFKCTECDASFYTQSQLTIHTRVHTGNQPFVSLAEYKQEKEGKEAVESTPPKKPYQCKQCPASFKAPSHLERHVRHKHTKERPYRCPHCTATFQRPSDLRRHLRRHTGETKFVCNDCPAAFKTSSALRWHERGHSGELKSHHCEQCPAAFRAQNDLNTHMRVHTGEKPYKCTHCPGAFAQSSTLRKHMRIHNRNQPAKSENQLDPSLIPPFLLKRKRVGGGHGCEQCGVRFIRPSDLVRHMRRHTGERPFKCGQCGKAFTRQSDLNMHNKIHTGEKGFKCAQCSCAFRSRGDLNKHVRRHTGEKPYMCAQCGQMFRLLGNLKTHMKSHPDPEPAQHTVEDTKPQIFTVQIVDNQVPTDHSYMCPGAVYPATQHIIIQASEAAAAGYFGPPTSSAAGYVSQAKQVSETGTQMTDVGTQVTPLTFTSTLPVKMEDKEVSTSDADFHNSLSPERGEEVMDIQEISAISANQHVAAQSDVVEFVREISVASANHAMTSPGTAVRVSTQHTMTQSQTQAVGLTNQDEADAFMSQLGLQAQQQTYIQTQPHSALSTVQYQADTNISLDLQNEIVVQYQTDDTSFQPQNEVCSFTPLQNVNMTDQTHGVHVPLGDMKFVAQSQGNVQAQTTLNTSVQPQSMFFQPQFGVATSVQSQVTNTSIQNQAGMNNSVQSQTAVNSVDQPQTIVNAALQAQNSVSASYQPQSAVNMYQQQDPMTSFQNSFQKYNQPQDTMNTVIQLDSSVNASAQPGSVINISVQPQSSVNTNIQLGNAVNTSASTSDVVSSSVQPEYSVDMVLAQHNYTVNPATLAQNMNTQDQAQKSGAETAAQTPSQDAEEDSAESFTKTEVDENSHMVYRFKCSVCKASFKREMHLNRHMMIHSGKKPHQCPLCEAAFFSKAQLTIHKRNHPDCEKSEVKVLTGSGATRIVVATVVSKSEKPEVKIVTRSGAAKSKLASAHSEACAPEAVPAVSEASTQSVDASETTGTELETADEGKDVEEGQSQEMPENMDSLVQEALEKLGAEDLSTPMETYKCAECDAVYATPLHLSRHAKNAHAVDKPHKCSRCPAAFSKPSELKRHIRNHTGQNPYVCPECPAAFTAMSSLKVHLKRTHFGEKKTFTCTTCSATFSTQTDLNTHVRAHTGEKPFRCSECPAEFSQSSNLNRHVLIHSRDVVNTSSENQKVSGPETFGEVSLKMNPGAKPFGCTECSASFTRSSDLKIHYRKHTGERPFLCNECPSTFARLTDLKMHQKIHTGERGFLCSECPAAFRSKGDLNKHTRVHTGEKPYMCSQCGTTFRQSGSLKAHLKSHVGQEHSLKRKSLI